MTIFRILLSLCVLGLVACTDVADVDRAVLEADTEVAAHHSIISGSASLAAARGELDRHAASIDDDLRRIRTRLDDVDTTCDTDRDGVWQAVFAVEARVDIYLADAGAAPELGAVRDACDDYRADMESLIDRLRRRLDDLPCW